MPGRLRCTSSPSIAIEHKETFQSLYHNNSSSSMATFKISVQPPERVQMGGPIYPPPVVRMSVPSGAYPGKRFAAQVFLLDGSGQDTDKALHGTKSVDGFPMPSSSASTECYIFAFPDLQIIMEGHFMIRVDIYNFEDGAGLLDQLISRNIEVIDLPVPPNHPSSEERSIMEIAKKAGALK